MKQYGGVQVHIEMRYPVGEYAVWVTRERGDGLEVASKGEYGFDWQETSPATSDMPDPTYVIPAGLAGALVQGLSDRGHRTEQDAKLRGTLEATRDHLSDLRKMLNLDGGSDD